VGDVDSEVERTKSRMSVDHTANEKMVREWDGGSAVA
jgi:hypothetical protein